MSESADKRYAATPARRERARREGNVVRSKELTGIAAFGGALAATALVLPFVESAAADAVRGSRVATAMLLALAFVPALAAAVAAPLAGFAQSGGVHLTPLTFGFEKLAPLPGLRRCFGGEALTGAVRASAAFLAVTVAVIPIVAPLVVAAAAVGTPRAAARAAAGAALNAAWAACAVGALFALADFALARRRWLHGLRMTFDELKRDLKEHDGDPQAKGRRRQLHRAIARGGVQRTREASFVVVNPTHVAVALRYAPPAVPVPEILVRAVDDVARAVRALAQREGIPLVENPVLARWLYRAGEAGRPIPAETFVAVAQTVAALIGAGVLDA